MLVGCALLCSGIIETGFIGGFTSFFSFSLGSIRMISGGSLGKGFGTIGSSEPVGPGLKLAGPFAANRIYEATMIECATIKVCTNKRARYKVKGLGPAIVLYIRSLRVAARCMAHRWIEGCCESSEAVTRRLEPMVADGVAGVASAVVTSFMAPTSLLPPHQLIRDIMTARLIDAHPPWPAPAPPKGDARRVARRSGGTKVLRGHDTQVPDYQGGSPSLQVDTPHGSWCTHAPSRGGQGVEIPGHDHARPRINRAITI